jgi:hypothetical protein
LHHSELLGKSDGELLGIAPEATHQHFKGGLYRYLGVPKDSRTGEAAAMNGTEMVVYEHLFPYERELWIREYDEFHGTRGHEKRFRELKK